MTNSTELERVLSLLDVEEIDRDLYRARNPEHPPSLYGGQVAAQALRAAAATVDADRAVHSAHGYFLRAGVSHRPTVLIVHRDRDGRSYSHRRVEAIQDGEVIFSLSSSFHVPEVGPEMEAPLERTRMWDFDELVPAGIGQGNPNHLDVFELRVAKLKPHALTPPGLGRCPSNFWVRPKGVVGDDPVVNACMLMFMSDMGSAFAELDLPNQPFGGGPTLDHSVWFHRPAKVDQWLLLQLDPLVATGGRGLYHGGLFDESGVRVASLTQEIVVRETDPRHLQRVAAEWEQWRLRTS